MDPKPDYSTLRIVETDETCELDKRTTLPFLVVMNCPECGKEVTRDLSDHYLSYPILNRETEIDMYHGEELEDGSSCEAEWSIPVFLRVTLEFRGSKGRNRQACISALSTQWFRDDKELQAVYCFEGANLGQSGEPVRLLQVTGGTPASPDHVVVYGFNPAQDFAFPLLLAQVTPVEWEAIKRGELLLPEGWSLGEMREVKRD